MLIKREQLEAIAAGTIECAFRRWRRPTVKAGGTLRTALGVVAIDGVEEVRLGDLTEEDARLAGHASLAELRQLLGAREGTPYRIDLHFQGDDPRIALRRTTKFTKSQLEALLRRLERMDARSRGGAWTRTILELLRESPGVRAGDLADAVGREKLPFKRDVRKLKELGLTESLAVGYRLSPRGERVLEALEER